MFVNFPSVALLEWHPFSLSSGPHQDYLEIHVKSLGNLTRKLHALVNGSMGVRLSTTFFPIKLLGLWVMIDE